jgi:hypothetical protein
VIDAVLSYHLNPQTCGVAKFNHALARRLDVPCASLLGDENFDHPLVSIKPSEFREGFFLCRPAQRYDLLLHDRSLEPDDTIIEYAERILYADEIGCPSTINGNAARGAYRVLVFGMAHKLNLPHFQQLKQALEIAHPDYTIELSTAVHEGNPWDAALTESIDAMRGIFGDKLRVLGFLGDDALAKELREVDAVAAYFTPALRANNTSYWAAVEAGKTIYTNRDEHSPQEGDPPASWDRLVSIIKGAA